MGAFAASARALPTRTGSGDDTCQIDPLCTAITCTSKCQRNLCNTDSDCRDGKICRVTEAAECETTAGVTSCTRVPRQRCTVRYFVPCSTATDCGPGFMCLGGRVNCTCAGQSTTNGPASGSDAGNAGDVNKAGNALDASDIRGASNARDATSVNATSSSDAGCQCAVQSIGILSPEPYRLHHGRGLPRNVYEQRHELQPAPWHHRRRARKAGQQVLRAAVPRVR